MKLRDLLRSEHVIVPLNARTVREATEQLARRLVESGAVAEPKRLHALIQGNWPEDLTSVGDHAFLPHFRTDAVRSILVSIGIAPTPIRSEKNPQRAARVVIFIVAPPRDGPTYLQVIGALARALSDPDTLRALHDARAPEEVLAVAALGTIELPSQLLVRDVMTAHVVTLAPETTLGDVARLMVERDVRALPVVDEAGTLLGMVSHKELLKFLIPDYLQRTKSGEVRALTKSQSQRGSADPKQIPVREAMASSVL